MNYIFSAADLYKFQLDCLPKTRESIHRKANTENWPYLEVRGKGGKGGIKRVYKLPDYVIAEIKKKKLYKANPKILIPYIRENNATYDSTSPHIDYEQWCKKVDFRAFVPIRYYPEIHIHPINGLIDYSQHICKPLLFEQEFIYSQLEIHPANLICITIAGDSMQPTLKSDGIIMIDISKQYNGEGIYLVRHAQELKIKRLQKTATDKMLIICDKKTSYANIEIDLLTVSPDEFGILGKYVWDSGIAR